MSRYNIFRSALEKAEGVAFTAVIAGEPGPQDLEVPRLAEHPGQPFELVGQLPGRRPVDDGDVTNDLVAELAEATFTIMTEGERD